MFEFKLANFDIHICHGLATNVGMLISIFASWKEAFNIMQAH